MAEAMRTFYQEAMARRGVPLRRRVEKMKQKKKKKKAKKIHVEYTKTYACYTQAITYLPLALLNHPMLY